MNLLDQTKKICKLYDIQPARSKGQNFLIREEVYDKIVEAAEIKKDEIVLEVGPGLGFLTAKLAKQAKKVIAVELDDKIAETLKTALLLQKAENIEVINKNVLDIQVLASGYKIVANLPYNITSVFLRKFLSTEHRPELMFLFSFMPRRKSSKMCPLIIFGQRLRWIAR
ncbi:MAG: Ribosomal RNA small subunit methyltransferase A [Parcubacteria group bacterium GW2011_GWE2_39_37]|nr:MAG: Ribosomal RNA small subunit methyltransferase A [Parcubacteria group bacterium GW2011_GWE2_39_37]